MASKNTLMPVCFGNVKLCIVAQRYEKFYKRFAGMAYFTVPTATAAAPSMMDTTLSLACLGRVNRVVGFMV